MIFGRTAGAGLLPASETPIQAANKLQLETQFTKAVAIQVTLHRRSSLDMAFPT